MKTVLASIVLTIGVGGCAMQTKESGGGDGNADSLQSRGRYLVQIAGCNDCHTPDYAMKAGQVAEKEWLIGDTVGWQGPWGTTYPPNLRARMQLLTEEQWLKEARTREMRPPMPWYQLRVMPDDDLRAIYRYIRSLSPVGRPAPSYLPPGTEPQPPLFKLVLPPGAGH